MSNIGNISRRNFFKLALAGAVVAGAGSAVLAFQETYADKIRHIMKLHAEVVAAKANNEDPTAKFDELLGYMMANFKCPEKGTAEWEAAFESVKLVFSKECTAKWTDIPPTLHEGVITFAVARDLLSQHRVRLDPQAMVHFDNFADTYQDLILAA